VKNSFHLTAHFLATFAASPHTMIGSEPDKIK
jgi:hypothetical protein